MLSNSGDHKKKNIVEETNIISEQILKSRNVDTQG